MQTDSAWRPALTLFLVLSLLDIGSTWLGLALGLPESNPLPAMVLAKGGIATMYGAKAIVTLLVAVSVVRLSRFYPRIWTGVRLGNGILCLVVSLNLIQALVI